eukprot:TRINITY_DN1921_c0_g1_i6.p1 TRINITY_DN1921_c0_g1~~TRINITY_DN1921_c0_g1_i6.p1  ORF type:complete len:219 (+),score=32.60 TRINITY_DN1921_c0_g1_i6:192-848(+)
MCGGSGLGRVAVLFGGKVVAGSDLLSDVGVSSQSTLHITAAPELRFDRERCVAGVQIHGDDDRVVSGRNMTAQGCILHTTALPLARSTGLYRWKVNVLEHDDGTYAVGIHRKGTSHGGDVVFYGAIASHGSSRWTTLVDGTASEDACAVEKKLSCVHCAADTDRGTFRVTRQWEGGEEEKLWKDVQLDDFELVADFTMCDAVISIEAVSGCFRPRRMS